MKFTVEIDIDWVDEESNLDEEVKRRLVDKVAKQVEEKFTDTVKSNIAKAADKLVTAKTEQLIYSILEKPVTVSNGWNSTIEYDSIYDMVEKRMTAMYDKKFADNGKCEKDPLLANIEKYVEQHVGSKLRGIETIINNHAKTHAANTLKQSNLAATLKAILPEKQLNDAIDK